MKIREIEYTRVAEDYDRLRTPSKERMTYWIGAITDIADIRRDHKVLDIGCGTGRFAIPLARTTGATIYGLDPSDEMLTKAIMKDRSKLVNWIKGRAEALPFPDEFSNHVLMAFVVHHVKNMRSAIREAYRALLPKGRLTIMTTSHGQFRRAPLHDFPGIRQIDIKRFPSLPRTKELLASNGFRNVSFHSETRAQEFVSLESCLGYVRQKPISTFYFLSEREFQSGLKAYEKKLRGKYGDEVPYWDEYSFVSGEKG